MKYTVWFAEHRDQNRGTMTPEEAHVSRPGM